MNETKIAEEILLKYRAENYEKELGLTETEVIVAAMLEFRSMHIAIEPVDNKPSIKDVDASDINDIFPILNK